MTIGNQSIVGDWEATHSRLLSGVFCCPSGVSSLLLSCAKHFANFQTGLPQPPGAPNNPFRKGLYTSSACADKSLAVFQCQQETGLQSCLAVGRFWEAPMSWSNAERYKRPVLLPLWRSSRKECRARESVLRARSPIR